MDCGGWAAQGAAVAGPGRAARALSVARAYSPDSGAMVSAALAAAVVVTALLLVRPPFVLTAASSPLEVPSLSARRVAAWAALSASAVLLWPCASRALT